MKSVVLILAGVFFSSICFSASPATGEEFLAAIRAAYEAKDVLKIDALVWDKGASAGDKKRADDFLARMLQDAGEIESVTLEPLPDGFKSVRIASGKRGEMTYPPVGVVKIAYKPVRNGQVSNFRPYAVIEGGYYLLIFKTTDLGWKGPEDRQFTVDVPGKTSDKVKIHIKYNASGIDLEDGLKSPGSSLVITGQYISEVTVVSDDPDADMTLKILDGKKAIYESGPLKGKGQIVYKKPD